MSSFALPDFTNQIVDDGRFHLTEILGAGNYGVVYKALDLSSPPDAPALYAIKCLGPVSPQSAQGSPHDEREIALHSLCSAHPNVITLYHRFCYQHHLFIVLELSTGGHHLFDAISASTFHQNDTLVRTVFLQLIDVVRFLHESAGVSHRDLKPENILCTLEGTDIRIADFGLAIDSSSSSSAPPKSAGGTLSYMSPESLTRDSPSESESTYDPKQSDVWALCVILLNMMSGLYPWRRAHDSDAGFTAFLTDAHYMRRTFPISDQLDELLERCFRPVARTRPTLLQLRTEFAALDKLFSTPEDAVPVIPQPLLLAACHSTPLSSCASFNFTDCALSTESSRPSTLATSVSFEPSMFHRESQFHSRPTVVSSSVPRHSGLPVSATRWQDTIARLRASEPCIPVTVCTPTPTPTMPLKVKTKTRNPIRRVLRWLKKTRSERV